MKKLLFIIVLISIGFAACGQRENMLPMKASSALTDTMRVIKDNQSSLMLRSTWQGDLYDSIATHTDTLQALRADIDAGGSVDVMDSIAVHRTELNNLHDSITDHRTDIDANLDSIADHRTELDNAVDSIAANRTEINANTSTGSTNGSNISANSVFIGVNTADIASLEDSITDHRAELDNHTDSIAAHLVRLDNLNDSIYKHTDTLQVHNTRLLSLEGASSGYWSRTGTDLSPATSGDDILLATNSEQIKFGDGDTWIEERVDDNLEFWINSGLAMYISSTNQARFYGNVTPVNNYLLLGDAADTWGRSYIDTMYIENPTTSIHKDGSNNLTFTDAVTGTKTLAELAAGGSAPLYGSVDRIPHMNSGGTNFDYSPNLTYDGTTLEVNGNISIDQEDYLYLNGSGGNTYVRVQAAGITQFVVGGGIAFQHDGTNLVLGNGKGFVPWTSKVEDIGTSSSFFDNAYFDRVYIDDASTYIDISSGDMTFTDANSGTKTLAQLAGASGASDIMHVARAQILYSNTSQTTIVTLPDGAVVWAYGLWCYEIFNGSGTDVVNIGITGAASRYEAGYHVNALTFDDYQSPTNLPDGITSSTNVTFQYVDQNSDATAGAAYVYIHYTLH